MTTRKGDSRISNLNEILVQYWMLLLASAVFFIGQVPLLSQWWVRWSSPDGYYSHGLLVPFLTALMVRMNRGRLSKVGASGSWIGILLLVAGLPLYVYGTLSAIPLFLSMALMLFIFGITISLMGLHNTRVLFLPLLFLATMMPTGDLFWDKMTGPLQTTSTVVAAKMLGLLGHAVTRYGNTITSDELPVPLLIASPCSGLRLFVTLATCTWFLAYITEGAWWRKGIIAVLALPLVILINSLRIAMIGMVGIKTFSESAVHSFHDLSGYISLSVCVIALYSLFRALGMSQIRDLSPADGNRPHGNRDIPCKPLAYRLVGLTAIAVLCVLSYACAVIRSAATMPPCQIEDNRYPMAFGNWSGDDMPVDDATRKLLGGAGVVSRMYMDNLGEHPAASLFVSEGRDRDAFHDPHNCLPGSGNYIKDEHQIRLKLDESRTVNATMLKTVSSRNYLVVYWYMQGNKSWAGTSDLYMAFTRNAIIDTLRVCANPFRVKAVKDDMIARKFTWYRFIISSNNDKSGTQHLEEFIRQFMKASSHQ